jgi:hypothetical protein
MKKEIRKMLLEREDALDMARSKIYKAPINRALMSELDLEWDFYFGKMTVAILHNEAVKCEKAILALYR